ncbi:MAG: cobalt-precorrin-5B (C(1))-methyltransferase CbiD [Clostridia bacterium]
MEKTRLVNQKLLRCGYTTGSCAAAAAKAATIMLLCEEILNTVSIDTPSGTLIKLDVFDTEIYPDRVSCAVQKDSGDDPDVTNGVKVYATVSRILNGLFIDGGKGVGRVTKPGLDQPVGEAAINSVPRKMIKNAVLEAISYAGYTGGISVVISIPEGITLAAHTFNPRMGIEGGISILGTSGIVQPMSDDAIAETIRAEISILAAQGKNSLLLTFGNYGENFTKNILGLSLDSNIKCSNFIGSAIDSAVEHGFSDILVIGHIGKLVKLGIGIFNTHSNSGDGRLETLCACALEAGATLLVLHCIMDCVSTDAAITLLIENDLLIATMKVLKKRIEYHINRRVPPGTEIGFVCFTNLEDCSGILAKSENADTLMNCWRTN